MCSVISQHIMLLGAGTVHGDSPLLSYTTRPVHPHRTTGVVNKPLTLALIPSSLVEVRSAKIETCTHGGTGYMWLWCLVLSLPVFKSSPHSLDTLGLFSDALFIPQYGRLLMCSVP